MADLPDENNTDEINIKGIYRDGVVGEPFVVHSLAVFGLYNQLSLDKGY
ncbi:MAG TPA: hypothetical protein VMR45_01040 [Patescibacteria group bacterium]|nr:hypothetical protein [Patescibacteria group bacterium]